MTIMMKTFFVLLVATACHGSAADVSLQASRSEVVIDVLDLATNRAVSDARVFVLSEGGRELTSSKTDALGTARLTITLGTDPPRYILADHKAFYVSGVRWVPGTTSRVIYTSVLVVR